MSKLVGYKEGNLLQDIRKQKDDQERLVISIKDVTMTIKTNKCRNKYITSWHKLRTKGHKGPRGKIIRT